MVEFGKFPGFKVNDVSAIVEGTVLCSGSEAIDSDGHTGPGDAFGKLDMHTVITVYIDTALSGSGRIPFVSDAICKDGHSTGCGASDDKGFPASLSHVVNPPCC